MKIIDLSPSLYDGMPVWEGDPEVKIKPFLTIDQDEWEVRYLQLSSHIGSHVNVPAHVVAGGQNLDDYQPATFMGEAMAVSKDDDFPVGLGLLFVDGPLTELTLEKMMLAKTPFFGVGNGFEEDLEIEIASLKQGIISYENLVNLDQLPTDTSFMFYGLPLKIKDGDGSPVRAIAVVG